MPFTLASQAMGTRFELVLPGRDRSRERAAGEVALEVVSEWERQLSIFRPDSLLSHVNREAFERPVRVDPRTFDLLAACWEFHVASQGAFDPAQGARMEALGFRGEPGRGPAGERVGGFAHVVLDSRTASVRFTRPGVQLDLGAVAKGHALDGAAQVLREAGVECALLHAGTSTVVAIGAPPGLDGWQVALGPQRGAPVVRLRDQALSVSAQHGRTNDAGAGHVLDPRTGEPVGGGGLAAVIASQGRDADAWSTALLVLGRLPRDAARRGVAGLVGGEPGGAWLPSGARGPFELPADEATRVSS